MKKRAIVELYESELRQIIAEYFGVSDKNDISFGIVEGQREQAIVVCTIMKEIEFPEKITIGRPNWWPDGVREVPCVQPTQPPVDTSKGPSDPIYPHDPLQPYVTWSDRTETTYTAADTKGENK